jgi:hypothetical protein
MAYFSCFEGAPTGRCIQSTYKNTTSVCEIHAWCPVENFNTNKQNIIDGTLNHTILISNNIQFEEFVEKEYKIFYKNLIVNILNEFNYRSNIMSNMTNKYISSCFNSMTDPLCPVFLLSKILEMAEPNQTERHNMIDKVNICDII